MKFARIDNNGIVTEVIETKSHEELYSMFHADIAKLFAACPDETQLGWIFENGIYSKPVLTQPLPSKEELLNHAADKRWRVETGGIMIQGFQFPTTRDDRDMITAAISGMPLASLDVIDFKTSQGWIPLTYDQITAYATAFTSHVQACYSKERQIAEMINTGKITSFEEIEVFSWPSNE